MFERFTDRARRVVVLAQEEAGRLNHNYIGTEHLLLGLISEGEGVAAKALGSLGIRLEAVRQQVEEIIGQGKGMPAGHIPFTPRAKKVLELSLREALDLGHNYIGTEHILLGLIREGEGVAAQVLVKLGAELDRVRDRVVGLLEGGPGRGVARAAAARAVGPRSQAGGVMEQIVSRLEAIEARLLSIERRLTGHPEPAAGLTQPSFEQGSSPPAQPPGRAEPPAGAPEPPAAAAGPATGSEPEPPARGQDGQDGEDNPPAEGATS